MLSGIKTGKKKKRKTVNDGAAVPSLPDTSITAAPPKKPRANASSNGNLSAAQLLKQQLKSGGIPSIKQTGGLEARLDRVTESTETKDDSNVVVLTGAAAATTSDRPDYRPEDFRHGSRKGKTKRPQAVDVAGTTEEQASQSIQEMIQEEQSNTRSMDEVFARNVARIGSRYKGSDFAGSSKTGADEDDVQVDMKMFATQQNITTLAAQQKERSRQLAAHDKEQSLTRKFWWWMESPSFQKHTLLALGNHVSLVMVPPHLSLTPGTQVYLVPIQHADSLVNCEDDVWNEISQFQTALRKMYAKENKQVLFVETVLPSSKGLWQTRLEAIPVLKRHGNDAPMYFKSALTEQAEEWGTHTKLLSTRDKGLRGTIPKRFPYFFVEWSRGEGYAQIIETTSFPKDFGIDTIAGMMQMDPLKFRARQKTSADTERQLILDFVEKWKPFDWTLELD